MDNELLKVSVTVFRANLGAYIHDMMRGKSFVVMSRGKPIFQALPWPVEPTRYELNPDDWEFNAVGTKGDPA